MFDSQRIKRLREILELSETQFAKKIGVAQSTYNRIEKGTASLSAEALSEIVTIFNVDPSWLLLGIGGDNPIFTSNKKVKSTMGVITYLTSFLAASHSTAPFTSTFTTRNFTLSVWLDNSPLHNQSVSWFPTSETRVFLSPPQLCLLLLPS